MTLVLTQARIDELQGYITAGNRVAYYEALASWGSDYAELALGVVRNDTLAGRTANNYMAAYAEAHNIPYNTTIQTQISFDLMNADFARRSSEFIVGNTGELSGKDIQDYHKIALPDNGFPPEAWSLEIGAQYLGDTFRDDALASESGFTQAINILLNNMIYDVGQALQPLDPAYTAWLADVNLAALKAAQAEWEESGPASVIAAYSFVEGLALGDVEQLANLPPNKIISMIESIHQINEAVGSTAQVISGIETATNAPPRYGDPLTLDMDKDGQVDLRPVTEGRMFDTDEDGFDERVGWVKAEDGMLARDLDSDGLITEQAELFGNQTTSGFTALSVLDSNSDGKIDVNDAAFSTLLVWQDANQDGIGQSTELQTLMDAGIKSISLSATNANYFVGGNSITREGTFTWNDNTVSKAFDVNLSIDNFFTRYDQEYELNPMVLALPTLRGYGNMPDLHIAMSLDNGLLERVKDFSELSLSNYTNVRKAVHDLLIDWANADQKGVHSLYRPQGGSLNSEQIHLLDTFMGANSAFHVGGHQAGIMIDRMMQLYGNRLVFDTFLKDVAPNLNYDVKTDKFQGTVNWSDLIDKMIDLSPTAIQDKVLYWYDMVRLVMEIGTNLGTNQNAYDSLINSALTEVDLGFTFTDLNTMNYQNSQGRGNDLVRGSDLETGQFVSLAQFHNHAVTVSTPNYIYSYTAGDDIIIGIPGAYTGGSGAYLSGGAGNDTLYGTLLNDGLSGNTDNDTLYGGLGNDSLAGNGNDDILYGQEGNDSLFGGTENDLLYGDIGNDYLRGDEGNDQIFGGEGDDDIEGGTGKDVIHGGDGNDTIKDIDDDVIYGDDGDDAIIGGGNQTQTIYGGNGNDTLDADTFSITDLYNSKKYFYGEAGNDTLTITRGINFLDGGTGDDTYLFDYIDYQPTGNHSAYTVTPSSVFIVDSSGNDQIKLTELQGNNISLERFGNDLYVYINYNYTITIKDQFLDPNNLIIESIYNADNSTTIDITTWTPVSGMNWTGTNSGDGQNGSGISDFLYGLGGNDSLSGLSGHDYIDGGNGNDTISGGAQNDILIGGLNDDKLYGGSGNDIYRFKIGDGIDLISEEVLDSENDIIEFTDSTTWENLNFDYSAYKLDIYYGTSDKISTTHFSVVTEGFAVVNDAIVENIKFSNSTTYNITENVNLFVSYSTINQTFSNEVDIVHGYLNADTISLGDGNDTAKGNNGNDVINGDAGNDWLYGDAGNDTLNGGSGNDKLYGGADNDTYMVSSGMDVIADSGNGTADKIVFGAGITVSDLTILRILGSSQDIVINWTGGNQVRILNGFSSANMIETIQFDDLSTIDLTTYSFTTYGTSIAETMTGLSTNDTMYGYEGNDTLHGYLGNDALYGGEGNDTLNGNEGNDTLYGENGDDRLNGHIGDDTIYGGLGVDTIYSGAGADLIYGGDGRDYIYAEDDNDTIYGDEGDDQIYGMNGNDTLYGGVGIDYLKGDNGDDTIFGNEGNDNLYGDAGNNILDGGAGNDGLVGGANTDIFIYTSGLDTLYESGGSDILKITGGITINDISTSQVTNNAKIVINAGIDEITISNQHHATTTYHIERIAFDDGFSTTLEDHLTWTWGTTGNDTLTGTAAHNTIIGKVGNDTLDGAGGDDDIHGGSGADTLYGGGGADLLHGGVDSDILHGGDGLDTLIGGSGADSFVFESATAFNNTDVIKDFSAIDGDALNLSDLLVGFDPVNGLISDYVSLAANGSNMTLSVDRDGAGTTYTSQSVAVLENVSGLNVDDLFNNNQIIV